MTQDEITAGLEIAKETPTGPWTYGGGPKVNGEQRLFVTSETDSDFELDLGNAGFLENHHVAAFIAASRTGWPKALEALQRVYEVHDHFTEAENLWCRACGLMWPCATIRAIEGAAE